MTLRVVFADDNYLVRVGVSALLGQAEEIELISAVGDADALLRAVAEHRPDVPEAGPHRGTGDESPDHGRAAFLEATGPAR